MLMVVPSWERRWGVQSWLHQRLGFVQASLEQMATTANMQLVREAKGFSGASLITPINAKKWYLYQDKMLLYLAPLLHKDRQSSQQLCFLFVLPAFSPAVGHERGRGCHRRHSQYVYQALVARCTLGNCQQNVSSLYPLPYLSTGDAVWCFPQGSLLCLPAMCIRAQG